MIPILNTKTLEANHLYPTLFGFSTRNKVASQLLNYVYGVVMVVATAFAFHALSLILPDWNKIFIFLASLSVVGLPYCIKIVLFGNEKFEVKHAVLCLCISILPAIFDFVGFYSETSVRQALISTKFELVEKVNYFNTAARSKIEDDKAALLKEKERAVSAVVSKYNNDISNLNSDLLSVKQTAIDEKEGVRSGQTTGKPGEGPRAREIEAEVRRIKAKNELEVKRLDGQKDLELQTVDKAFLVKEQQLDEGINEISKLVSSDAKVKGILYQINNIDNFNDLAKITILVNNSISTISSKMEIEPQFVSFKTDDVIQLSFGALLRGEITALICFLLAFLLEMVDTIIVWMIRGAPKSKEEEKEEDKTKLFYKKYNNTPEVPISKSNNNTNDKSEKIILPTDSITYNFTTKSFKPAEYNYLDHPQEK